MTYPKCKYCSNPRMPQPSDHWYEANGLEWCLNMCGTCIDVEYCCNVSKELWGTKRLAYQVALMDHMPDEVLERLRGEE